MRGAADVQAGCESGLGAEGVQKAGGLG
ncbi:hypothetical protein SAMN05216188_125121, partial [Lentzea xinjiangensis]